jgi:protoporphyrinogen oxidase
MERTTSEAMDVAVTGGGISGLYAATKLLDSGHHVVLFEAAERIGGGFLSTVLPGMTAPAELGTMRFRVQHLRLVELLRDLYLKPDQKPYEPA